MKEETQLHSVDRKNTGEQISATETREVQGGGKEYDEKWNGEPRKQGSVQRERAE